METRVQIETWESERVENLFIRFTGYCNILGFLARDGSLDTDLFDKKWEEAIVINNELEQLKLKMDQKYHPTDDVNYTSYSFDFKTHEMVYVV